jgi:subfamily B ATP-binding cassette protein MsbA
VGFVSVQINSGDATTGDFAALLTALLLTAQPIRSLGKLHVMLQKASAALERIFQLIDEQNTIHEVPNAEELQVSTGRVVFAEVSFSYGEETVLHDVNLYAERGELVALVGASGAGKSTVFKLIPRLYDVSNGAITVDGQNIQSVTLKSLRQNVAVVSQEATLFNDTIQENIRFGNLEATDEEVVEAAKAADAHEFIVRTHNGYQTLVGDYGGRLSGGQRQRIAIARAILKDAPILLLDEATSALDSEAEKRVQQALDNLRRGRTTFAIAHRLSTVTEADRIYVFEKGRVVEVGKHKDLVQQNGIYARISRLQLVDH